MEITDKKALSILSTALLRTIDVVSKGRLEESVAVGLVHTTIDKNTGEENAWLIKFDVTSCAFGIDPLELNKYKDGTIFYWHEDNEDAVTKAALRGDNVIRFDDEL